MAINFMIPLRAAQFFLGFLVLALNAYVASWFNGLDRPSTTPSQIDFLIFVGVWTCAIAIPYLTISPRFFPAAAHKYGILAAETVSMVFWFAGFVASATYLVGLESCKGGICEAAKAGVVFAAFSWVLFLTTTVMAVMYVFRTQGTRTGRAKQTMEV